ncbi:MAG TPA: Fe-S cluster assembly protein SufD [Dehalococcoidia bacterium]|nr:Fe-S cluster assembly protein SufD [Dehalococcoidia bacterium]
MTTRAAAPAITEATVRAISQRHDEPSWLLERRLSALRAFEAMAMPNVLEEEWRRTDLAHYDIDAALSAPDEGLVSNSELICEDLPAGVVCSDLHTAAREHKALVKQHLHSLVSPTEWKLGALEAAAWEGGAFIYIPRNVEVQLPIRHVLQLAGPRLFPHLLVIAEANSSVTILQESSGEPPSGWSLLSGAVEIVCAPDARVRFVDVQRLGEGGTCAFSTMRGNLGHGSELSATLIGVGGLISRTKLEITLAGEGSRAELLGLTYGAGKQHFDYITLQDHIAPKTSSDLLFKAALDGEASEVWNGTVRIGQGASQSEANQTSRNLLLSEHARAAPIPVLEIEAYDVLRCSHGATAGPLDEEQLFYLESRGISAGEAQRLLVDAFFRQVLDRVPSESLQVSVEGALRAKLQTLSVEKDA